MAQKQPRRLRSSTVVLGGMGVLAAALTSCGSDPDRRCVDRDSYDAFRGYKIIGDQSCNAGASGSSSKSKGRKTGSGSYGTGSGTGSGTGTGSGSGTGTGKSSGRTDPAWYYDAEIDGTHADYGTFSRSEAVDRDGFGCSGSGSGGG
ncbi:hypothetical protein [Streptomyces silaceus]|uniref:hypothetical protein n=1 Tax=Streptomyces silaceus TaxID=545123 RepID=UPI0006EBA048|nr:hypothetical protein [Streptomyces silaceus]